jgi:tetratricopeptide (TPR) repeat protein
VAAALLAAAIGAGALGYWATLPPYHERLLARAQSALRQADYDRAAADFTATLALHPTSDEALWGRARAYQKLGRYLEADTDLRRIKHLPDMGRVDALRCYCLGQDARIDLAITTGEAARRHGFESPELLSNLGALYYRKANYATANELLTMALSKNKQLVPAKYYRALIDLKRSFNLDQHPPDRGLVDIEGVIQDSPPHGEFFAAAADIYGVIARGDPTKIDNCLEHIRNARRYGIEYAQAHDRPEFSAVQDHPSFAHTLSTAAEFKSPKLGLLLIDPIAEDR